MTDPANTPNCSSAPQDASWAGQAVRLEVAPWSVCGPQAAAVRRAVFVAEQGIPESEEWDDMDAVSGHAVLTLNGEPVATGRLLPDGKIGRMAVLARCRGRGLGAQVLKALVQQAQQQGLTELKLSSQLHAVPFYAQFGFRPQGPTHDEVGIAHQWMVCSMHEWTEQQR